MTPQSDTLLFPVPSDSIDSSVKQKEDLKSPQLEETYLLPEGDGSWGDDELYASDLSATFIMSHANLTKMFNKLGYKGSYPTLLYFYEEAEKLNDRIISELGRSQAPDASPRFGLSVETHFNGDKETISGNVVVRLTGVDALSEDLRDIIREILADGIKNWLEMAYSTYEKVAHLRWQEINENSIKGLIYPTSL